MLICENCGNVREDIAIRYHIDHVIGNEARSGLEVDVESCTCGGEFVEAVKCPICGNWVNPEEKVCENCYKDKASNFETVYSYIAQAGGDEEILDFLNSFFGKDVVISLLKNQAQALTELPSFKKRIFNYIKEYKDDFINYLEETNDTV